MSIAEKLTAIGGNQQKVYDAGYDKGMDDFWEAVQSGGKRSNYGYAFNNWSMEYIRPKYKVVSTVRPICTFEGNNVLKKVESQYFDWSGFAPKQQTQTEGLYATFRDCVKLEEIEDIGLQAGYLYATYSNCFALKTISVFRVEEQTGIYSAFKACYALENVEFQGTIGQNGFDLRWSTKLTADSIRSLINALSAETTGLTVTLSQAAREAAFTDEEWAALIATKPNWTISLI